MTDDGGGGLMDGLLFSHLSTVRLETEPGQALHLLSFTGLGLRSGLILYLILVSTLLWRLLPGTQPSGNDWTVQTGDLREGATVQHCKILNTRRNTA